MSRYSTSAIVQGKEAFLARYLARQFPSRHQVIPVYLEGAPAQTDLHGLQTTSGFREDRQSADEIAQDLVAELRRMGDVADQATRTLGMIDEVALKWLFPPGHPFLARYELKGDQMLLLEREQKVNEISRDEFGSKLRADDLRLIRTPGGENGAPLPGVGAERISTPSPRRLLKSEPRSSPGASGRKSCSSSISSAAQASSSSTTIETSKLWSRTTTLPAPEQAAALAYRMRRPKRHAANQTIADTSYTPSRPPGDANSALGNFLPRPSARPRADAFAAGARSARRQPWRRLVDG